MIKDYDASVRASASAGLTHLLFARLRLWFARLRTR